MSHIKITLLRMMKPFIMMAQSCGLETQSSDCQTLNMNTHHYMYTLCKFTFTGFFFFITSGIKNKTISFTGS